MTPTEFKHFRNRIGKEGAEKLLKVSIQLFGKEAQGKEVLIDSTVQERILTTQAMPNYINVLIVRVIKLAKQEGIPFAKLQTVFSR